MIRFALRCANDHAFESWFASGAAYDALSGQGRVNCPVCGDTGVEKALMTPAVAQAPTAAPPVQQGVTQGVAPHSPPTPRPAPPDAALAAKLEALRRHVETNSDYVGMKFASEARAMHLGDAPARAIHGEARLDEARALVEEGVPVAPLPFLPRGRTH